MKLTITSPDLQREQQFAAQFSSRLDNEVVKPAVLTESTELEEKIVEAMPVDTGRARSSWGHSRPGLMVKENPDFKASDAVWEVLDDGKTIIQGTDVIYVPRLNEGSSRQAPAGFIDAPALLALEDLEKAVGDGAERLWRGG